MKTAKHPNDEADLPEEDSKPPAKRPRRKAAIKSEKLIAGMAEEDDDVKNSPAKRPRRKKAALKSEEPAKDDTSDQKNNSKKRSGKESAPIPVDAMVNVMEFLPPRSLYNIALTCKSLREMVTTKMVVQSALIHGGNPSKSMAELHSLMRNHSIHVPSPLRLLRLANGKRCEFCLTSGTNHVRPGLGVFACWNCVVSGKQGRWNRGYSSRNSGSSSIKLTKAWKTSWVRYRKYPIYHTILSYSRVASNEHGTNHYFWSEHRCDASGERVGPLVTWGDVDDLKGYYDQLKTAAAAKEAAAPNSTVDSATASNVAAADNGNDNEEEEEEEAAPSLSNGEWIEYYLTKNLNAPPKENYAEFNETFTNTVQMADRISREREELKKSKRDDKMQTKVEKVEKILDDLKALINEPFRERAMKAYGKEKYLKSGMSSNQCMFLETPFINAWLAPYIKSPSKMTKKAMKEMAEKINVEIERIEKLLEMDFLSDDDDFEAAAKIFFRECYPDVEALYTCHSSSSSYHGPSNMMTEDFVRLIQGGRFLGALCYLQTNNLSPILLVTEPSASLAQISKYLDETSLKKLAQRAWNETETNTSSRALFQDREDDSWAAEAFAAGHKFFGEAMAKVDKFGAWLEGKVDEDKRAAFLNKLVMSYWYFDDFMKEEDFGKIWKNTSRLVRS